MGEPGLYFHPVVFPGNDFPFSFGRGVDIYWVLRRGFRRSGQRISDFLRVRFCSADPGESDCVVF